jgi:hypothetical protein
VKGAGAFLVVFVGLLLLWVVLAGKAGNLSAAANVLTGAATTATPTTATPTVTVPGAGTTTLPNLATATPTDINAFSNSLVPSGVGYNAASYVSPTGLTYGG